MLGFLFFVGFTMDAGLLHSKIESISSGTLATLPLPLSPQTFFSISTMLWVHLLQK